MFRTNGQFLGRVAAAFCYILATGLVMMHSARCGRSSGDVMASVFDHALGKTTDATLEHIGLKKAKDTYDAAKLIGDAYSTCRATGADSCELVSTFCGAYSRFAPTKVSFLPLDAFIPDVNKWCRGEPTLRCCRFTDPMKDDTCWTAFSHYPAINCESRFYGGTTSPGPCLQRQGALMAGDCDCHYLSQCPMWHEVGMPARPSAAFQPDNPFAGPETVRLPVGVHIEPEPALQEQENATEWATERHRYQAARRIALLQNLKFAAAHQVIPKLSGVINASAQLFETGVDAVENLDFSVGNDASDFVAYRGCMHFLKGHLSGAIAGTAAEFPLIDSHCLTGCELHQRGSNVAEDAFKAGYDHAQRIQQLAMVRLSHALPGFFRRVDWAAEWSWDAGDEQRFLNTTLRGEDPAHRLRKYLSPVGLQLLKTQDTVNYQLLAPDLSFAGRSWQDALQDWQFSASDKLVDGCLLGEPVEIMLEMDPGGTGIFSPLSRLTLDITIGNPLFLDGDELQSTVYYRVDWGDNLIDRLEPMNMTCSCIQTAQARHVYAHSGVYVAEVTAMNAAGLISRARTTIEVSGPPGYQQQELSVGPAVKGITLELVVQGDARSYNSVEARLPTIVRGSSAFHPDQFHAVGSVSIIPPTLDHFDFMQVFELQNITFLWSPREPLGRLAISCRSVGTYVYARNSLRLKAVHLHLASSIGHRNRTVSFTPHEAEIVSEDGTRTQGSQDAEGLFIFDCARRGDVEYDLASEATIDIASLLDSLGISAQSSAPDVPGFAEQARDQVGTIWVEKESEIGVFESTLGVDFRTATPQLLACQLTSNCPNSLPCGNVQEFQTMLAEMNTLCCGEDGVNCASGTLKQCSGQCANALTSLQIHCGAMIAGAGQLEALVANAALVCHEPRAGH